MNINECINLNASYKLIAGGIIDFTNNCGEQQIEQGLIRSKEVTAAMIAYGYQNKLGFAEGHYNTISKYIAFRFAKDQKIKVLDVGCGPGRVLYDNAGHFNNGEFIGIDSSLVSLIVANSMLRSDKKITVDLSNRSLPPVSLEPKNLSNVSLGIGDACGLPFKDNVFDCVINSYLIDRVSDPFKQLQESIRVLKPNGMFIFSSPLNFKENAIWSGYSAEQICRIMSAQKIVVKEMHDGMVWRKPFDNRGNYIDWKTLFIMGFKQ